MKYRVIIFSCWLMALTWAYAEDKAPATGSSALAAHSGNAGNAKPNPSSSKNTGGAKKAGATTPAHNSASSAAGTVPHLLPGSSGGGDAGLGANPNRSSKEATNPPPSKPYLGVSHESSGADRATRTNRLGNETPFKYGTQPVEPHPQRKP